MAANECGKVVIVRWPCPDPLAPKFGAPSTGVRSHKYFSVIFALSFALILALYLAIC